MKLWCIKRTNDSFKKSCPKSSSLFSSLAFHHSAFLSPNFKSSILHDTTPTSVQSSNTSPDLPQRLLFAQPISRRSSTSIRLGFLIQPLNLSKLARISRHEILCSSLPKAITVLVLIETRICAI